MVTIRLDQRLLETPLPEGIIHQSVGKHEVSIRAPAGRSVNETLQELNLSTSQAVIALVNGQTSDLEDILKDGDQVRLLPQIAGGDG